MRVQFLILVVGAALAIGPSPWAWAQNQAARRLVFQPPPGYPEVAKKLSIGGGVKLLATVAPSGRITSLKAIGGHPLLVVAAMDRVKHWRYEVGPKQTAEIIELKFSPPKQ